MHITYELIEAHEFRHTWHVIVHGGERLATNLTSENPSTINHLSLPIKDHHNNFRQAIFYKDTGCWNQA